LFWLVLDQSTPIFRILLADLCKNFQKGPGLGQSTPIFFWVYLFVKFRN
jgi:hypothetical protein